MTERLPDYCDAAAFDEYFAPVLKLDANLHPRRKANADLELLALAGYKIIISGWWPEEGLHQLELCRSSDQRDLFQIKSGSRNQGIDYQPGIIAFDGNHYAPDHALIRKLGLATAYLASLKDQPQDELEWLADASMNEICSRAMPHPTQRPTWTRQLAPNVFTSGHWVR